MKLNDVIEKLEENPEFQKWRKENPKPYIAHGFMMMDQANENMWQIGYYNPDTDKMTTFIIEGDDIKIAPETEIFKKPGAKVHELELSKVKIGSIEAIEKANEVMSKEYPRVSPMKMFFIVQTLPEHGTVYNMTFISHDLKTVNIRVSSETGEVMIHSVQNLIDTGK